jgi:signal transduction histidine kinase
VIASKIDHDSTLLTIVDNGVGFDTDKKTGGFGITSMRDRVRDLPHGTFDIQSTAGVGTQIILSWRNES